MNQRVTNQPRQRKLKELSDKMKAKGYAERTIQIYSSYVSQAMNQFDSTRLLRISNNAIYAYSATLKSDSARHQLLNALKCYYNLVEGNQHKIGKIHRPKKKERPPLVYSSKQVLKAIELTPNKKHRAMLYVLYGTGVRRSELINLQLTDILRERNRIRVVEGKGGKTRETICDDFLLEILSDYWRSYRPKRYLFEGHVGEKYSASSLYNIVKAAFKRINLKASPHLLRHCFATHMLEANINARKVQIMMGHKSIKTLEIYSKLIKIGRASPLSIPSN